MVIQVYESHSPRKFRLEEIVPFRGNRDCKIVKVENLENPFVVPLLMNCKHDNGELIVSSVPHAIQENGTFLTLTSLQIRGMCLQMTMECGQ